MPESVHDLSDVWVKATPRHMLEFLKLCGVEGGAVARGLGVSPTAVSLWVHGHRPVPAKYRPRILAWAHTAYFEAHERLSTTLARLPTPIQQRAAVVAFRAPFARWRHEVLYDASEVLASTRNTIRWLGDFLHLEAWTAEDLDSLYVLWEDLGTKLDVLRGRAREQGTTEALATN